MIKIGITGTHGVGKTTLARKLAWMIQQQCGMSAGLVTEIARTCKFKLNHEATPRAQQWLFHRQFVAEIDYGAECHALVCDRTVIDPLAYAQVNGMHELVHSCMPTALAWMETYDALIFMVPNGKPIVEDGFRDTDPVWQLRVNGVIAGWLDAWSLPVRSLTLEQADDLTLEYWAASAADGPARLREAMGCQPLGDCEDKSMPSLDEILNGPDAFRCERFGTRMLRKRCVERQKERNGSYSNAPRWPECQGCPQGKQILDESLAHKGKEQKAMTRQLCKVEGCEYVAKARGFCGKHYDAWRAGRLDGFGPFIPLTKETEADPGSSSRLERIPRCG